MKYWIYAIDYIHLRFAKVSYFNITTISLRHAAALRAQDLAKKAKQRIRPTTDCDAIKEKKKLYLCGLSKALLHRQGGVIRGHSFCTALSKQLILTLYTSNYIIQGPREPRFGPNSQNSLTSPKPG